MTTAPAFGAIIGSDEMAKFAKAAMLLAVAGLFFALVCPLAATPMPVGKVKNLADSAAPPPAPIAAAVAPAAIPLLQPVFLLPAVDVLELPSLTCVLTC